MKSLSFKICFVILVVGAVVLGYIDKVGPGIIAFELAKTIENANAMVSQWELLDVLPQKKFSLYFDYLFIIGYAGSLFFIIREWSQKSYADWKAYLIYLPILAGILDAIENYGLLQIVYKQGTQLDASLAFYCASIKFLILIPCIIIALIYLFLKVKPRG